MKKIGIIGGSGLDNPDIMEKTQRIEITTPYGNPTSMPLSGRLHGHELYIIARHGTDHSIPPSEVNYRANIDTFRQLGVDLILVTTATGSLREEIGRGDLVFPDQFIDHTYRRINTFYHQFDPAAPQHTPMADPFDPELRSLIRDAAVDLGLRHHEKGTLITIEGPRFSTRAESMMFRQWGADIINMSVATECALANEAKIPYAAVAMATDYDCWKMDEEPVSHAAVVKIFEDNAQKVTRLLVEVVGKL